MNIIKISMACALIAGVSACGDITGEAGGGRVNTNKTIDYGQGNREKPLSELSAGVWIDPNGCDHWIIDDGIEGYLSQRLDKFGKPVCSGVGNPGDIVGPFQGNQTINDPI